MNDNYCCSVRNDTYNKHVHIFEIIALNNLQNISTILTLTIPIRYFH